MWTIFAMMFDAVGTPLVASVDSLVRALQGWMRPILIAGVALFVMGKFLWRALRGHGGNPLNEAVADAAAGSIIAYVATEAAGLGPMARDLLLRGLSTEIGRVVLGALGGTALNANLFDDAWGRAWAAGLGTFSNLPWSGAGIALGFFVVLYWIVCAVSILVAFLVWLSSFAMVALLVGLWPLGVGLFAFPWTRGIAWGWLRSALANVLLQVLCVALLALLLGAIAPILAGVTNSTTGAGLRNEFRQLQALFGGMIVFLLVAWLAYQLPGLAAAVTHGFTGYGQVPSVNLSWLSAPPPPPPPHDPPRSGGAPPVAMPQGLPPGRALG
ncbi:type IV secretion system protein [Roseicella aquatilis]|nr:type IV secretion system protein [Roseicella aquatilis]